MDKKYIKTNRTFTFVRKWGFLFTLLVAIGGLFEPKIGLLGILVMVGLVGTSLFGGKYWCGNICPHGSYFDRVILPISRNKEIPSILKSKPVVYGVFIFFVFNFTRKIISISSYWGTFDFLDKLGTIFATTYLVVMIIGSILGVLISPRAWCKVCPMGTMEDITYKVGSSLGLNKGIEKKVTISDIDTCKECGLCEKVCPMQIEVYKEFDENGQISTTDCIKCNTCVENCPLKLLSMEEVKE